MCLFAQLTKAVAFKVIPIGLNAPLILGFLGFSCFCHARVLVPSNVIFDFYFTSWRSSDLHRFSSVCVLGRSGGSRGVGPAACSPWRSGDVQFLLANCFTHRPRCIKARSWMSRRSPLPPGSASPPPGSSRCVQVLLLLGGVPRRY